MKTQIDGYLLQVNRRKEIQKNIRQVIVSLSLIVVLGVFWGLKLTGITMAGEAFCGMDEHVHSEECPIQTLICTQEEIEPHSHGESCIVRRLICESEEKEPHTHDDSCREWVLSCTLPEESPHTHGDACILRDLTCMLEETEGHAHGTEWYDRHSICGIP